LTGQIGDGQNPPGAGPPVNETFSPIDPGDYNLTEGTLPPGYTLSSAVCESNSGNGTTNIIQTGGDFTVAEGETQTCTFANTYTTPVTVSYFASERTGDTVDFRWQTASESGTAGFNVYAEKAGVAVKLNEKMIASQVVDSLEPTDYAFEAKTDGTVFYLDEVSIEGKTDRHGPYELGVEYGSELPTYLPAEPSIYLPFVQR